MVRKLAPNHTAKQWLGFEPQQPGLPVTPLAGGIPSINQHLGTDEVSQIQGLTHLDMEGVGGKIRGY